MCEICEQLERLVLGEKQTFAEYLISMYERMEWAGRQHGGVTQVGIDNDPDDPLPDGVLHARFKTMIDFNRQSPAFKLRAIVEGWNATRINREMY